MSLKRKLFEEPEVAKMLGVSSQTLAKWRRDGKVRHYRKVGRLKKYTQEDIDNNIAEMAANRPQPVSSPVENVRFG